MEKALIKEKNADLNILLEQKIMQVASSPFVVRMYYSFHTQHHLFLVMEFMPGGDCYTLLRVMTKLPESMARMYIAETVLALEYLHSKGIVHRDLKPDNMLIGADGHIKLTDFGLSKMGLTRNVLSQSRQGDGDIVKNGSSSGVKGTPDYLSPEVIMGTGHGKAVDWWALGCVLYEFLTGIPPFFGATPYEIFERIFQRDIVWPDDGMSPLAKDLINKLLNQDPVARLGARGAQDIKTHPLFAGLDWNDVLDHKQKAIFMPKVEGDQDLRYFAVRTNEDYPMPVDMKRTWEDLKKDTTSEPNMDRTFLRFNSIVTENLQASNMHIVKHRRVKSLPISSLANNNVVNKKLQMTKRKNSSQLKQSRTPASRRAN
eukprot:TRINITY_DN632_c0_g1_i1.p1 TRINITY_DN632_c0_g1~~TRINITY_DN632_c0_g1_i1.p1  ORF type:complete len:389 (-),score=39.90 TRINITY_DN632_c0_g1_i1:78-1193(-)